MADLKIDQLPSAPGSLVGTDLAMTSSAAGAAGYTYTRDWDQVKAFVKAAFTASEVANVPAGNISATNVQAAINELDTEKLDKTGGNMTGQLAVNVSTGTALAASQTTSGTDQTNAVQVLQSTDAGANGPTQVLWHNSPSPAANDLIRQRYIFNDSLGNPFAGVSLNARLDDPTDGSEDASLILSTVTAGGALTAQAKFGNGIAANSLTYQGVDSINFSEIFDDNVNIKTLYVALNGSPGQIMTGYLVVPVLRAGDLDPSDGLTTPFKSLRLGSNPGSVSLECETGNMFMTIGKTSTDANPAVARMNKSRGTLVPVSYLPVIQNDVAFRFDAVVNTLTGATRNTLSIGRNDMRMVAATPSATDLESDWTLSLCAAGSGSLTSMAIMRHSTGLTLRGTVRINQNGVGRQGAYGRTWQTATPTNGGTTVLTDYVGALLLSPAATIATHTLTMPADPVDGQEQMIKNSTAANDITALTINGNTGQTMEGAVTTLTAGQYVRYMYRGSSPTSGTWYRVG